MKSRTWRILKKRIKKRGLISAFECVQQQQQPVCFVAVVFCDCHKHLKGLTVFDMFLMLALAAIRWGGEGGGERRCVFYTSLWRGKPLVALIARVPCCDRAAAHRRHGHQSGFSKTAELLSSVHFLCIASPQMWHSTCSLSIITQQNGRNGRNPPPPLSIIIIPSSLP